ncbi:MAG: cobalamin B12-binding domain-containing protein [Actinomycetota bacterium]|nr:cobalamin B12-binding domain-containing protein [Actinomycetota bacterium]
MVATTAHRLLERIVAQDREAVVDAVVDLARGEGLDAVIALLADVQREVGRRWQNEEWSVADEHAATALADLALAAAALGVPPAPQTLGSVVVTCAEEEWHVLPARMFAEQLRAHGWDVAFLGASTPAAHLATYLARRPVMAVAVSCSVPIHLPGARRSIAAVHGAGVPVMAGGAAFGSAPARAHAVGADAWAASIDQAHDVASSWSASRPPLAGPRDDREQLAMAADREQVVDAAMADLEVHYPDLEAYSPWQRRKAREDLDYIVRFVEAAVLTADDTVVVEFMRWLVPVLSARGVPPSALLLGVGSLRRSLPRQHSAAARLLEMAADLVIAAGTS